MFYQGLLRAPDPPLAHSVVIAAETPQQAGH